MVALEAAATGVAVIGSDIGGIPEAIIDGETGFLAPERDVEALAARMALLLSEAALRRQMGAAARAMAERKFDLAAQTHALEARYDEVLAKAGQA